MTHYGLSEKDAVQCFRSLSGLGRVLDRRGPGPIGQHNGRSGSSKFREHATVIQATII